MISAARILCIEHCELGDQWAAVEQQLTSGGVTPVALQAVITRALRGALTELLGSSVRSPPPAGPFGDSAAAAAGGAAALAGGRVSLLAADGVSAAAADGGSAAPAEADESEAANSHAAAIAASAGVVLEMAQSPQRRTGSRQAYGAVAAAPKDKRIPRHTMKRALEYMRGKRGITGRAPPSFSLKRGRENSEEIHFERPSAEWLAAWSMLVRTYDEANCTDGEPSGLMSIGDDKLWTSAKAAFKKLPSVDRRATGHVQLDPDPTAAAAAAAPPVPAVDPPPAAAAADDGDRDGDGATSPPAPHVAAADAASAPGGTAAEGPSRPATRRRVGAGGGD